jgi:hypothetical protein
MRYLEDQFKPSAIFTYFDRLRIWLREPLPMGAVDRLRKLCAKVIVRRKRAWFDWRYRGSLEILQPTLSALQFLARLDNRVLLNYVEIACDFIFAAPHDVKRCLRLFRDSFLQLWHRPTMIVKTYLQGYTTREPPEPGERRTGQWFQYYIDQPCRLTQESHCFHLEGKYQGVQFLQRVGLWHPRDLTNFDFDDHFTRKMMFYRLDLERLDRYDDNCRTGRKRRTSQIETFGSLSFNVDFWRGVILYRRLSAHPDSNDSSLQQFVNRYGRGPFLTRLTSFYVHINKCSYQQMLHSGLYAASERSVRRDDYIGQLLSANCPIPFWMPGLGENTNKPRKLVLVHWI